MNEDTVIIKNGQPVDADVVFVRADSAIAMYINGRLAYDSSFITRENVLNALGISHATFDADELWWSEQAGALFPARLEQVKTVETD